ncbi:carnosine N-methyltransferase [Trifolium repens]|nr:carnosine N-methyltransferase [Trifolium repens]
MKQRTASILRCLCFVSRSRNARITLKDNLFGLIRPWLDPSFQLNVPLVDVDKVRCIIRNIVRDWAVEVIRRAKVELNV